MTPSVPQPVSPELPVPGAFSTAEIDVSCRLPLFILFISAAIWAVIASVFGLISSIKFHDPNLLADCAWLTYGRVRPVYLNSMLYGFCVQGGLGVGLWMLARLGATRLSHPGLILIGAALWNLGLTLGIGGILAGESTGIPLLEMPRVAPVLMFVGYLVIGVWAVVTFHHRRQRWLYASQWFFFAALFWFAWVYSTANLLLLIYPVRGITQSIIGWWYAANLQVVWFGLTGLGTILYFVPRLTGRELHSHHLSLLTFWMITLFGCWTGIPYQAPVPSWLPVSSRIATVFLIFPLLSFGLNLRQTMEARASNFFSGLALPFFGAAAAGFFSATILRTGGGLLDETGLLALSWFTPAVEHLQFYAFFAMTVFGGVYVILPQLTGLQFHSPRMVKLHFWLAVIGIALLTISLAVGGIVQASRMRTQSGDFMRVVQGMLMFLRVATIGDLLLAAGHVVFAINVIGLVSRFARAEAVEAIEAATEDLYATGAKS
jgi:cytochrome c oxidase cbb3-type subunit I